MPQPSATNLEVALATLALPGSNSCRPSEAERVGRLRTCVTAQIEARRASRWRRPPSFQDACRLAECEARQRVAAFCRWARQSQLSMAEAAAALGVPRRTLARWEARYRSEPLSPPRRGRQRVTCSSDERNKLWMLLTLTGGRLSLAALRSRFPQIAPAELRRVRREYRQQAPQPKGAGRRRLLWSGPGRVWAIDFVDWSRRGPVRQILSVRDLATRKQLLWLPLPSQAADLVAAALRALIVEHGAPLVIKRDNGAPFTALVTHEELVGSGVAELPSPVRCPRYNGVCERGNRTMKEFTSAQAAAAGRAGQWLAIDLEQALLLANQCTRPWGRHGPSPDEAWERRAPISAEERQRFEETFTRQRAAVAEALGDTPDKKLTVRQRDLRDRRALSATLQELGYVTICERRDPRLKRAPTDVAAPAAATRACAAATEEPPRADSAPAAMPASAAPSADLCRASETSDPAPVAEARAVSRSQADLQEPVEENAKFAPARLLAIETPCTLEAGSVDEAQLRIDPEQVHSAHGEPGKFQVLRRLFTPLQNVLKLANIR